MLKIGGGFMKDFGVIITSMVTPFKSDLGIDFEKTKQLIEHLYADGTDTLLVGSGTGEGNTLTHDEKLAFFNFVKKEAYRKMKVLINVPIGTAEESIRFIDQLDELGYADGVMVNLPDYLGYNQERIFQYIKEINDETELPILLHNEFYKKDVQIDCETVIRLSRLSNVFGIEECRSDFYEVTKILAEVPDGFDVYGGDDRNILPIIAIGGKGIVSIASHVVGSRIKEMISYYKRGLSKQAMQIHQDLSVLLFGEIHDKPNPYFIKALLRHTGRDMGDMRNTYPIKDDESEMFLKLVIASSIN